MCRTCYADNALVSQHVPPREALQGTNLKQLLRTVEALADLGPELTADRDFSQTARKMLAAVLEAAGAQEAVLFSFGERPSVLTSVDAQGVSVNIYVLDVNGGGESFEGVVVETVQRSEQPEVF